MDYSTIHFGKSLRELTYSDIERYFEQPREETTTIEFKSFNPQHGTVDGSLDGIITGICAFLNSEGGILIWGAPKGEVLRGKKEKIFHGALHSINALIEKDTLINKISTPISALPVGIQVERLEKENNFVYIFEIQKSNYSPHQYGSRYYARIDGQSVPAPHYLVEALFRKITYPTIEGYIKIEDFQIKNNDYHLHIYVHFFNWSPLQNEENISFQLTCNQGVFNEFNIPERSFLTPRWPYQLNYNNFADILHLGEPKSHLTRIIINANNLSSKFNNEIKLFLGFGGKLSPYKTSTYSIMIDSNSLNKKDGSFDHLIKERKENILAIEGYNNTNYSKEEILKDILGR